MMQASGELKFELAAKLRDEVRELKKELREMTTASR
jgi:excinuclease ABC subunit B